MPALLHAADLEKAFGDRVVLRDCGLTVERGDRIGLVGANGCGKSTLLKLLSGDDEPDGGRVERRAKLGYLRQEPRLPGETVGESAREALSWHRALLQKYERAIEQDDVNAAAECQSQLDLVGWELEHRIDTMLGQVGAPPKDALIASLSGGETRRVALARLLLEMPDLMLLDEPTNHLDADTIEWLEDYLRGFRGAVVMVTHDRYMLESVANRIIEVQDGETIGYTGSYGDYLVERAVRRAGQQRSEDRRLSMIRREAAWASRSPAARTGKQKGRLNRLDTLRAARNLPQEREFEFGFETGIKSGNTLVEMYGLCKGFSDRTLIKDLDLTIRPGDRIGILGANGCGKSTLLNIIARKLEPDAGTISYGPRVQIGMLDQHRSGLKPDDTVLESAGNGGSHVKVGDDWSTIQGFLGRFLFDRTHFDQKVSKLSGGERARLLMAKLLLERNPLLLLDEPTNDLDLLTLRVLEEALLSYDGGAIIVTHDRAFLDRVCTAVLSNDGEGNWVMYASRMQQVSAAKRRLAAIKMEEKRVVSPPISVTSSQPSKRLSYQEKRDLEGLPAEIEALELEMTALTETMNDPATYRERAEQVPVLAKRLAEVEVAIETMFERWTELEERQGS